MWKTCPWLKELPFEDFCEYLLPYRVGDEPLTSMDETHFWRKVVQQSMMDYQFTPRLDDIKSFQNMYIINNDAPTTSPCLGREKTPIPWTALTCAIMTFWGSAKQAFLPPLT